MNKFLPITFQLNNEQCEAIDFIDFEGLVFNAGDATLSAPPDEPRRFLLLEFSGPDAHDALVMLGEGHAGFAWTADDHYRAVLALSRDANPDECLTHCEAVQKVVERYLEVTFNEVNSLPTPTKDTAIHPLSGNPIATSGMLRSVSACDLRDIDRRALFAFIKRLPNDRDLWALDAGRFPAWAVQTKRGHDEAYARVLHQHGAKPEWIAWMISNNRHGLEARHHEIGYLNEIVREVCATEGEVAASDPKAFAAPYLSELWDHDVAVDWMIYGVIQVGTICEIWAPSGVYKTFIALDMAAAVASGEPWHNEKTMRQGPVLYIPGEGRAGIVRRLKVLCQERGLSSDLPIRIANQPVMMGKENQGAWLLEQIALLGGVTPALLILDTLARNFGGNENSAEDIGRFLDNNSVLIRELGITVLVIHHCGYDDNHARGSSSLYAGIDIEYRVVADKANHSLQLQNKKMKDADEGRIFYFKTKVVGLKDKKGGPVLDSEKNPITSIVLHSGGSERAARQNDFFKQHPALKGTRVNRYTERLPLVLQAVYDDPAISDRAIAVKAAPGTSNHKWVGILRGILLSEGLVEGDRFELTSEGVTAANIFCERVDFVYRALSDPAVI